ncbi:MAG: response regulator [Puniceicoccales bacterium]|jgi:CheY-like chemotaxis protein|nr:response regulator [Puniceicoccales bacterium]
MLKILLIEDDSFVQFSLKKLLECFGHEVMVANNGKDGLVQYKKGERDVILCDIDMPALDGFQFFEQLKQSNKKLPFFSFISAYVDTKIIQKSSELGVDCIIKKPVDQEILKVILLAMKRKHMSDYTDIA